MAKEISCPKGTQGVDAGTDPPHLEEKFCEGHRRPMETTKTLPGQDQGGQYGHGQPELPPEVRNRYGAGHHGLRGLIVDIELLPIIEEVHAIKLKERARWACGYARLIGVIGAVVAFLGDGLALGVRRSIWKVSLQI